MLCVAVSVEIQLQQRLPKVCIVKVHHYRARREFWFNHKHPVLQLLMEKVWQTGVEVPLETSVIVNTLKAGFVCPQAKSPSLCRVHSDTL